MSILPTGDGLAFNATQRRDFPSRKLASESLTASERVIYECPVGKVATIMHVHFASTHSGSETVTMWHVRPNEATALRNALYYEYSLSAKTVLSEDAPIYMIPGERLIAKAGAADRITLTIYGLEG